MKAIIDRSRLLWGSPEWCSWRPDSTPPASPPIRTKGSGWESWRSGSVNSEVRTASVLDNRSWPSLVAVSANRSHSVANTPVCHRWMSNSWRRLLLLLLKLWDSTWWFVEIPSQS